MKNVNAYKISHFSSCTVSCRDFISPHMSLFSLMHPLLLQLSVCIPTSRWGRQCITTSNLVLRHVGDILVPRASRLSREALGTRMRWGENNLVPRACDPWEGNEGSGIIRCRKPGIVAKIELRIHFNGQSESSLKRIIPEPSFPSRGSQARGTRLGRKVHQWRIGPESFGRVSPTKRHENHCFHAYATLGNGC